MELKEKLELNKQIRAYKGENSFVLSIQKQLKTSKYVQRIDVDGKSIKVLTDKQYESIKIALS
jgi:hypothetical protein